MKVLVTGGSGLVGKAIQYVLNTHYSSLHEGAGTIPHLFIFLSSTDCNLLDKEQTMAYFKRENPGAVIHLAAHVGGLYKNMNEKVLMYENNMEMNLNVLRAAFECGVRRMICCLSTCIFPDEIGFPINEAQLHLGAPHDSNEGYAYAKRMLEMHCRLYRRQAGVEYICVTPTNLFGEFDNFSLENGHVLPSLIHRANLLKSESELFQIRGSGVPRRQFVYARDFARVLLHLLDMPAAKLPSNMIVSPDEEYPINMVAQAIAAEFDIDKKRLTFDYSYADGQLRKTADNSLLKKVLPNFKFTNFHQALKNTAQWFKDNYPNVRL